MSQLDLKFVCHHGEFVKQRIAGRDELAGRDVIVVHRLLKNTVADRLSGHAYALFTDAAIEAAGIDPAAQGIAAHEEIVDIIGRVGCRVLDLSTAWREETERSRHRVTRRKAAHVIEFDISAPRPQVWEYVTTPGRRTQWRAADDVREFASGGRRGVGTTNHCMHGPHAIIEEILDWRPYDYLTLTTLLPMPDAPKILMTYTLAERADGGTRIEFRIAKPKPKDAAFLEHAVEEFRKHITAEIATLGTLIGRAEAGNAAGEDQDISVPEGRDPPPRTSRGDDGLSKR